ncbi:hypothetical protein CAOG_06315 [Capsaspora owczarzaki ATCC 30864]|uniref:Replication factor A protein 3 n=1 Tax=Capsaspora owczarzaki (strain ATCC 30864) TaxID=595528 RepID=A0A0D2WV08_CAPO3|nr:hypothetical protein CAOG_06315 [Capsaspora owczarzaki ATCC 30864]KJE95923.1 hypothetical protein CAOG_006315 [Capsaspora owczarzaki ATCC 30864]|eukprot:XP_004345064.1 hypothetical protein CAOG_06315 [Capsaspora owczarzaki ATCC 30864]
MAQDEAPSEYPPTPRVNNSMLAANVDRFVRLVGTVMKINQSTVTIRTSDKGETIVHTNSNAVYAEGDVIEYIGSVQPDLSLVAETFAPFPKSFNMDNYNTMIELARKQYHLFSAVPY